MKPIGAVLLIVGIVGFGALLYLNFNRAPSECPTHWHATFAVFTPDSNGDPKRLDMGAPRAANGASYYQLNYADIQTINIHMHQSGPEQGSSALGVSQLHYEGGRCVGVKDALRSADIMVTDDSMDIIGQHSQSGSTGSWENSGRSTLRVWHQAWDGAAWTWKEVSDIGDFLDDQLKDGEAIVVAYGDYTPDQVAAMQAQVPAPMSRPNTMRPASTSATSATTTAAGTTSATNATQA